MKNKLEYFEITEWIINPLKSFEKYCRRPVEIFIGNKLWTNQFLLSLQIIMFV